MLVCPGLFRTHLDARVALLQALSCGVDDRLKTVLAGVLQRDLADDHGASVLVVEVLLTPVFVRLDGVRMKRTERVRV